jgi:RTX calcium-binding nonapeptide repeat (4 copies)
MRNPSSLWQSCEVLESRRLLSVVQFENWPLDRVLVGNDDHFDWFGRFVPLSDGTVLRGTSSGNLEYLKADGSVDRSRGAFGEVRQTQHQEHRRGIVATSVDPRNDSVAIVRKRDPDTLTPGYQLLLFMHDAAGREIYSEAPRLLGGDDVRFDEGPVHLRYDADGRVYCVYSAFTQGSSDSRIQIQRFLADGRPDPQFNGGAPKSLDLDGTVEHMTFDPQGRLVLIEALPEVQVYGESRSKRLLHRFDPTTTPRREDANDLGFRFRYGENVSFSSELRDVIMLPNGEVRMLVVSTTESYLSDYDVITVSINRQLESGQTAGEFDFGFSDILAVDGRLDPRGGATLVVESVQPRVYRVRADGTFDPTFSTFGQFATLPITYSQVRDMAMLDQGRLLMCYPPDQFGGGKPASVVVTGSGDDYGTKPGKSRLAGNRILEIVGTSESDSIDVRKRRGVITVAMNGKVRRYSAADVGGLLLRGGDGNDRMTIAPHLGIASYLMAGNGDDVVNGSDWNDILIGGAGNDTIDGLGGSDSIYGQDGADRIAGGTEADFVFAGRGDDRIAPTRFSQSVVTDFDRDIIYSSPGNDVVEYEFDPDGKNNRILE